MVGNDKLAHMAVYVAAEEEEEEGCRPLVWRFDLAGHAAVNEEHDDEANQKPQEDGRSAYLARMLVAALKGQIWQQQCQQTGYYDDNG